MSPNQKVQGKWRHIVNLKRGYVKWCKKARSKYNRRQGKKLLEDAPPENRYDGYAD